MPRRSENGCCSIWVLRWLVLLIVAAFINETPAFAKDEFAGDVVTVRFRTHTQVPSRIVWIRDVATIDGGTEQLRARVAGLDLDVVPAVGDTIQISQRQVEFRLRLAGISRQQFEMRGPAKFAVSRNPDAHRRPRIVKTAYRGAAGNSSLKTNNANAASNNSKSHDAWDDPIADTARQFVLEQLPWNHKDITIRLAHPIPKAVAANAAGSDVSMQAKIHTKLPPLGMVQTVVTVSQPGKPDAIVPVVLDVRRFGNVVVSKRQIDRIKSVTADDVMIQRQEVSGLVDYFPSVDQVVGKFATRTIGPAQLIKSRDLEEASLRTQPVVIKFGDQVHVVARLGGVLAVRVKGEALQEGRVGERIRIRNISSQKTVVGRVVSGQEVEVIE